MKINIMLYNHHMNYNIWQMIKVVVYVINNLIYKNSVYYNVNYVIR